MTAANFKFINHRRHVIAPECPCGKSNKDGKFSPIEGLDAKYGKCHSCSKLFLPKEGQKEEEDWRKPTQYVQEPLAYIPNNYLARTIDDKYLLYNNFLLWLTQHFGEEKAAEAAKQFLIGTAKGGKTIFWHIDEQERIRTGRIFLYSPYSGKRDKQVNSWAHSTLKLKGRFQHCLFGIHQLHDYPADAPVFLTESSKNAVVGWIKLPNALWLGTDGATGLTNSKAYPLRKRHIHLVPDCDPTGREKSVAHNRKILEAMGCTTEVVDLDPSTTDGSDVADFFSTNELYYLFINQHGYPAIWDS